MDGSTAAPQRSIAVFLWSIRDQKTLQQPLQPRRKMAVWGTQTTRSRSRRGPDPPTGPMGLQAPKVRLLSPTKWKRGWLRQRRQGECTKGDWPPHPLAAHSPWDGAKKCEICGCGWSGLCPPEGFRRSGRRSLPYPIPSSWLPPREGQGSVFCSCPPAVSFLPWLPAFWLP